MKRTTSLIGSVAVLVGLSFASVAAAQWDRPPRYVPPQRTDPGRDLDLSGTWYMHGDPRLPCEIRQRDGDRALFINEKGDRAWGVVEGRRVWIPDWNDGNGSRGLEGRIRGDRIVWPNGSYWAR